jgi:hypothetical protein
VGEGTSGFRSAARRAAPVAALALVVALAAGAAGGAEAPPASAESRDVCAGHPSDPSVVCVRNSARTVDVCDRDPDGHRAYARVTTQSSYPAFMSPYYDSNDSKSGCSNLHFPSSVVSVSVCVQFEGCSAARSTGVPPPPVPTPTPTATPTPVPAPPPAPPPPPPAPQPRAVGLEVGIGCTPRGRRVKVKLAVRKRPGKAKPRVRRVVFYYRKRTTGGKRRAIARIDRRAPYRRALPVRVGPGAHRVFARVVFKRVGSSKVRRKTVSRRFTVCA